MMYKSPKIASQSPSKCLKPVSNPYMMSRNDLAHFSKNRKKIDFLKKNLMGFSHFDSKNREKPQKPLKTQSIRLGLQNIKNGTINSQEFWKSTGSNVGDPIWPKCTFLLIYRFGYKKAPKIKKCLHQQNLQDLSFLWKKESFKNL